MTRWIIVLVLAFAAPRAESKTVVVTYVKEVQKERKSTRWTLTEWLRIKQRMKLMDVWLAMFSNPKKDKFSPEFNLSYFQLAGDWQRFSTTNGEIVEKEGANSTTAGQKANVQLWLTNLISGTLGIRMINIDLGLEGYYWKYAASEHDDVSGLFQLPEEQENEITGATANLRLFGKSIQDSSLVVKYGQYQSKGDLVSVTRSSQPIEVQEHQGSMFGGELSLYFWSWFGVEGNYLAFEGSGGEDAGAFDATGSWIDYSAFIEISFLKFQGGMYQEEWNVQTGEDLDRFTSEGILFGAKLQL